MTTQYEERLAILAEEFDRRGKAELTLRAEQAGALDLLRECRKVLEGYRFTTVDCFAGITEDIDNDDVIELCERLDAFFAGQEAGQ